MTYPLLNSTNPTNDLTQLLVYTNTITDGWFMFSFVIAFFLITLIGGYFAQERLGKDRFDISFAVAGFATFGLIVLLKTSNGLIPTSYLYISLIVSVIGVLWLTLGEK